MAKLIAQKTDVLVAPILLPGISPYHMEFPGTITLSSDTVQRVYLEATQSLIHHGFRRFLLLTSHTGNQNVSRYILDRINQETQGIAVELNDAANPFLPKPKQREVEQFDRHAGVGETSSSLYLFPDTGKHTSTREMSKTGVWSERDTREASTDRGRLESEAFVDASVQFIERWKALKPLKPLAERRDY